MYSKFAKKYLKTEKNVYIQYIDMAMGRYHTRQNDEIYCKLSKYTINCPGQCFALSKINCRNIYKFHYCHNYDPRITKKL